MHRLTSFLFLFGLTFLIAVIYLQLNSTPMPVVGEAINAQAPAVVGAGNIVTAVVLGYRGFDTLVELTILFAAATAVGLIMGAPTKRRSVALADAGFILQTAGDVFFPLLLVIGCYIVAHGHLTPGGGFQGGVILATAFFVPVLARPASRLNENTVSLIEGTAGAGFILVGLLAAFQGNPFLTPLFDKGQMGDLLSAGSLPILYLAVGLKVGAELAGLLVRFAHTGGPE